MTQPIAISMGDPAGLGPELIGKLIQARPNHAMHVFGDRDYAERFFDPNQVKFTHIPCTQRPVAGQGNPQNAQATKSWIEAAVDTVKNNHARALLTAPINKSIIATGCEFPYPGHTEFLADLDGAKRAVMMLTANKILSVIPVTIHCSVADIPKYLTPEALRETIEIASQEYEKYHHQKPRIAVAGLNPHAGEGGRMGDEEIDWIAPCLNELRERGYDVSIPLSADTMFHAKARENYDLAIAMYHDQALIPIKTLAFDRGVNVTLGLGFLRASPDHGTGYEIAGQSLADAGSMIAAYDLLDEWTRNNG